MHAGFSCGGSARFESDGARFQVRDRGYKAKGNKVNSGSSLYDLVAIDIIKTPQRLQHVASTIELPSIKPVANAPALFIINCHIGNDLLVKRE